MIVLLGAIMDLSWEVVIRREDGDRWPDIQPKVNRYRVTELAVRVTRSEDGTFTATWPPAIHEAHTLRDNGTMGPGGPRYALRYSEQDLAADEQRIRGLAVAAARAAFTVWLAQLGIDHAPTGTP